MKNIAKISRAMKLYSNLLRRKLGSYTKRAQQGEKPLESRFFLSEFSQDMMSYKNLKEMHENTNTPSESVSPNCYLF
jgi:hypothetical protein